MVLLFGMAVLAFLAIAGLAWVLVRVPGWTRLLLAPMVCIIVVAILAVLVCAGEETDGFDPVMVPILLVSLTATVAAHWSLAHGRERRAIALLLLVAFLLRAGLGGRLWLSRWDESFHALVARNLMKHPLKPTLVDHPLEDVPACFWAHSHIWLHKPPLALWLMAGSMTVFGKNEIAMRAPSVVVGALGVLVTFLLAKRFLGARAALFAATFHAWHGRGAQLAAGLLATDHVDNLLVFLVGLGVLVAVWACDALAARRRGAWVMATLVGLVLGLALLTKGPPSLIIPAVFFMLLLTQRVSWVIRLAAPGLAAVAGLLLCMPWEIYTACAFPEAYAYKSSLAANYFVRAYHEHGEVWYWHFKNIPSFFGVLTFIPIAAFTVHSIWRRRDRLALVGWFALTYGVFSLAAMKMKAYVFIASPVIWCALGWFSEVSLYGARQHRPAVRRTAMALGIAVGVAFFLCVYWGASDVLESDAHPRNPTWTKELRYIAAQVKKLPPGKWVVFNVHSPIEAMFYGDATFWGALPTPDKLRLAKARGFSVAVYGSSSDYQGDSLETGPSITFIPIDPRTLPARHVLGELTQRGLDEVMVYNARRATDLEAYLDRFIDADVYVGMPRRNRRLLKKLGKGKALAIVIHHESAEAAEIRAEFPEAVLVENAFYARR